MHFLYLFVKLSTLIRALHYNYNHKNKLKLVRRVEE